MILYLNHGQADIERGFSVNKNLLKDNIKEASLNQSTFHLRSYDSKNNKPETLVMTKGLLKSVKSAATRYDEYLSDQKKEKNLSGQEK